MDFIAWFSELSKDDVPLVGGKGANLGEMYNAKLPIPPGFVVTSEAFKAYIENTKIKEQISSILSNLDIEDNTALQEASRKLKELIMRTPVPKDIADMIKEAYSNLDIDEHVIKEASKEALAIVKGGREAPLVAVRSSATAEDLPEASFAGQQETFMNVKGEKDLLEKVLLVWASLFEPRSIFYRSQNGFDH